MFAKVWEVIADIFRYEGENMTNRQWNIFHAILEAYHYVQDERGMRNEAELMELWKDWKRKAERDELTKIGEIAVLFFLALEIYGRE